MGPRIIVLCLGPIINKLIMIYKTSSWCNLGVTQAKEIIQYKAQGQKTHNLVPWWRKRTVRMDSDDAEAEALCLQK
ncbi:hypothetical protein U9M48_043549 [Paspalum notatum var. saurae]|uniref:Uncharacterized protein n=1 Tax=Paspalum notatum var. saurae TaxID=547442 RepID=A0AAQ3XIP6_PASNO